MINFIFCQQISTVLSSHVFIHVNFQAKTIQLIYNFNPLWINTALKPQIRENDLHIAVLFLRKFYLKLYFT